ncbi:polyphosphate kinase 1 [Marinibactrum halimedae]|uniref:Polyphosphate kinase n=1 Tax=Marinibactrum halimedae TaxID=1444977 RepID=A0AA37WN80_9GAMM|nr:polyphosphate kinase 1 [Marinibactrum halimedae]MCD9458308.1 polyphosphate kinase 1 [Marinibactrum halimedae]GLS27065.1 polyphosphate kinase [Marinibactrum halimedae]
MPNDLSVSTEKPSLDNPEFYINRELSHLTFNQRVLEQALNTEHPLLERLRFLLIFSSNIDEFFEIRVAGLMDRIDLERQNIGLDGLTPEQALKHIAETCHPLVEKQYHILNTMLIPELQEQGVHFLRRSEWTPALQKWVEEYFLSDILPVSSPIGLDPAHPFPLLVNKSLNFIVSLEGKDAFGRETGMAIVPAPRSLDRVIQLPDHLSDGTYSFVFLSSMIHAHVDKLFPGMTVKGCYQFRVTRNADLDVDMEGVADLAIALKGELASRRFGRAVRLEVADDCPEPLIDFLLKETQLTEAHLYQVQGPVNLKRLMRVPSMVDRPDLLYPSFNPGIPRALGKKSDMFSAIAKRDYLLLHPFESFKPVVQLLRQAAIDPNVMAIKQTLYRTGDNSPVVQALLEAARNGKEVTAVVELRARFDEAENLELAAELQAAGAVVVYGVVGYKTHSKMILVVRRENDQLKRYAHLGTGNYHADTARLYTDYSLLTADENICADVHKVFQQLTGMGKTERIRRVLNAPFTLKTGLIRLIQREIDAVESGQPGRVIMKANGLTEPDVIHALYRASQAGVKVDLIIRGMCCLRPGIPGVSDNIRVKSIVGRFLEHTRVYYFANSTPNVYCGSADLMERNLNRRVEVCFPIESPKLTKRVLQDLEMYLDDNNQSWTLTSSGEYEAPPNSKLNEGVQSLLLESLRD